ncbi:MAG: EAL domain-containing protein [Anaeromicrobium sp.]|jgi:diguanylate cyclase (GGDEF)-like protein|uniref:putative bifunctional diguanylate cyclase/phosphodiesterase n=1 Tax=Anaeromicrobium sp. TaxID=1929132 RepID=UPI0025E97B94|nr:EAL domain-containing protein [Anaeromicrobium sp.]MCT4593478.1 EAL domain-containing protein [Anaeromicrobium sp.]
MEKKTLKKSVKIIIGILLGILLITNYICIKNNLKVDSYDFLIEGLFFIVAVTCFFISLECKITYLSMGWAIFSISLLNDALDELKFISFPKWQDLIFEEIFLGIGIILIAHGFSKAIEEKINLLEKLKHVAFHDSVTGLPNRRFVKEKLTLVVEDSLRKNINMGIIFIDLDEFKLINDTLGHYWGDDLLRSVTNRLKEIVRDDYTIGRLGGDEFIIIVSNGEEIESIAINIMNTFKEPFKVREREICITASMGISKLSNETGDVEKLFKDADVAMYKAKAMGRNNYKIYNNTMDEEIKKKIKIEEDIRKALKNKEFVLHYQPKINIGTGKITGVEALVRWNHPKLGLVYPDYFIQLAEETELIKEIDEHILELACLQIKNWINRGLNPVNIAVNISGQSFNENKFMDKLDCVLTNTSIDPSFINIEITETAAMKNIEYAHSILKKLREKKIGISLDDFGKGYSSLSYLKTFSIDVLKIDKLFVDGIGIDKRDESLIKAVITIGKELDIKIVCEGVETTKQLEFLNEIGCHEYQGYLFSKPVNIEKIEDMMGRLSEFRIMSKSS